MKPRFEIHRLHPLCHLVRGNLWKIIEKEEDIQTMIIPFWFVYSFTKCCNWVLHFYQFPTLLQNGKQTLTPRYNLIKSYKHTWIPVYCWSGSCNAKAVPELCPRNSNSFPWPKHTWRGDTRTSGQHFSMISILFCFNDKIKLCHLFASYYRPGTSSPREKAIFPRK